ncbi:hypothetical protein ACWEF9_38830 [Streptomyces sp. NPDC004980]
MNDATRRDEVSYRVRLLHALRKEPEWESLTPAELITVRDAANRTASSRFSRVITGFPDGGAAITWQDVSLPDRVIPVRVYRPTRTTAAALPYWEEQGRTSVDAVFVALAVTGLLLLGVQPQTFLDYDDFRQSRGIGVRLAVLGTLLLNLGLAAIVIVKGKIWTGLFGMFFTPLLLIGAIRLSRPGAPWARWRYGERPKTMARAIAREQRYRRPVIRAKIFIQDLIAGKPDVEHAKTAAEAELARRVVAAPPAPPPHPHLLPRSRADTTPGE